MSHWDNITTVDSPEYDAYLKELDKRAEFEAKVASDNIWRSVDPVGYAQHRARINHTPTEEVNNAANLNQHPK